MLQRNKKGEITLGHALVLVLSLAVIVLAGTFAYRILVHEDTIESKSLSSYQNIVSAASTLFADGGGVSTVDLVQVKFPWKIKSFDKGNFPCRANNCICICNDDTCLAQNVAISERQCAEFPKANFIEPFEFDNQNIFKVWIKVDGGSLSVTDFNPNQAGVGDQSSPDANNFQRLADKLGTKDEIIQTLFSAAKEHNVDPSLAIAIIQQENAPFDPSAENPSGAKGLMQLKDVAVQDVFNNDAGLRAEYSATETSDGEDFQLGDYDAFNPDHNLAVGIRFLKLTWDRLSDVNDPEARLKLAVAVYNAGWGKIGEARALAGANNTFLKDDLDAVLAQVQDEAIKAEVSAYVPSVLANYDSSKELVDTFGFITYFNEDEIQDWMYF